MVTELREGVYWIDGLRAANAFLIEDDGELMLVDAGTPGDGDAIRTAIQGTGHGVADVDRVLVTHYDYDHVGGLAPLEPDLDAPVTIGTGDAGLLTEERAPPLTNHKGLLQRVTDRLMDRPSLAVEAVEDGDAVGSFTAYHTPGHSPGHTAYVSEARSTAMLGDLVREDGGALEASPWIVSYDTDALRASIRDLATRAPSFAVAGMGHGEPIAERGDAALGRLADRLA